jgi:hypothetical protein
MDHEKPAAQGQDGSVKTEEKIDRSRRRLTGASVAGTGVLMAVASRKVLAGEWGTCTGSELLSGPLSRPEGEPNPCGCSPGYWQGGSGSVAWPNFITKGLIPATYAPTAKFNVVFGVNFFTDANTTLLQAINKAKAANPLIGSGCPNANLMQNIAFHATAALLNAAFYGSRYPVAGMQTPSGVISAFQTAYTVSPCTNLNAFKNKVDIYTSQSTWCVGAPH